MFYIISTLFLLLVLGINQTYILLTYLLKNDEKWLKNIKMLSISPRKLFFIVMIFIFYISILYFTFYIPCQPLFEKMIKDKSYDIIMGLNKNLKTHFVWYLEKKKGLTMKLDQFIEYQIRQTFIQKLHLCAPKASPRPLN